MIINQKRKKLKKLSVSPDPAIWQICGTFLATRFLFLIISYFYCAYFTAGQPSDGSLGQLFLPWDRWDALVYLRIAQSGYKPPFDLAFFPLYPLLISAIAHLLGDWSYLLVGMVLSNIFLLGAMLLIYRLASKMADEQVARRTVLYLCIFPSSFFLFTAYNESLFIFLTAATFLALRHRRWWCAGLLGCLSILTRSAGAIIVIPFFYEIWLHHKVNEITPEKSRASVRDGRDKSGPYICLLKQFWGNPVMKRLYPILLIPLGMLAYCIFCQIIAKNPLAFVTVQSNWGRQTDWPWSGIWREIFEIFQIQPFGSFYEVHDLIDLSATLAFIALIIIGRRSLPTSYTLWTASLMLYYLLSPTIGQADTLTSNQRFVLEMFPALITLAILSQRHPRLHQTLLWIFPALLATLSIIFIMGKWMV